MTIHEYYARKTNTWTAGSLSDNIRFSISLHSSILVSCDCTVLTLSRASGICSLPGWPGNLRHQLPWIQIHDDTAVSRKKLASNQQCLASRSAFRSYGPQLRCTKVEQCRDDEGTPPSFDQRPHAVGLQSYQYYN